MMYHRFGVLFRIIYFLFISVLLITVSRIQFSRYSECSLCPRLTTSTTAMIFYNRSLNTEGEKTIVNVYSILCLELGFHLDNEQYLPQSPVISTPSFNSQKLYRFPYRYSQWKSSSIFPRAITPCEHHLIMHLLIIIDGICREHEIIYFITEGTLLGSIRHHDIVPWDDDVDIILSYQQRKIFSTALKKLNQTLIEFYLMRNERKELNTYKLFYKNSPTAGEFSWRFPFIDIFFYTQNETHLWRLTDPGNKIKIKHVFPLVMRPFGQIWLPAPRKPRRFFQFNPFDECVTHFWDHRNEVEVEELKTKCNDLKNVYPFVERNNRTNSTEVLKINGTIIHTINYE